MTSRRALGADEVLERALRDDPEFRAEWERLAPARAIANLVVAYRAERGLSQTAFARLIGLTQPAVARLEAAEHNPRLETLQRLAARLAISISVTIDARRRSDDDRRGIAGHGGCDEVRVVVSASG